MTSRSKRIAFLLVGFAVLLLFNGMHFLRPRGDGGPRPAQGASESEVTTQITRTLEAAQEIRIFKFDRACETCARGDLDLAAVFVGQKMVPLDAEERRFLIETLKSPASYIPSALQKPMPFIADFGISLEPSGDALLYSSYAKSVRLVLEREPGKVRIFNVDPIAGVLTEWFGRQVRKG